MEENGSDGMNRGVLWCIHCRLKTSEHCLMNYKERLQGERVVSELRYK